MTTILTLLAMVIFSIPEGERTVRAGQTVTVNVTRTAPGETNNIVTQSNPLYSPAAGNAGTNPLY